MSQRSLKIILLDPADSHLCISIKYKDVERILNSKRNKRQETKVKFESKKNMNQGKNDKEIGICGRKK